MPPATHNFLNIQKKVRRSRKQSKRRRLFWWVFGVLVVIGALAGTLAIIYWQPTQEVMAQGMAGKDGFLQAQDELLNEDFSAAQITLAAAITNFEDAQTTFQQFRWLKHIPWVGIQIRAIDDLLSTGIKTGQSIQEVAAIASSIATPLTGNGDISLATLSDEQTHQLLENIHDAKPKLEVAKVSIDEAVTHVEAIPSHGLISKIKEVTDPLKEQVPQIQDALDQAISISQILPGVVGYPEQKTYLFLLQNNTELRPTGGFIGTYGILKIKDGDIVSFETDNTYNLDIPSEEWLDVEPPWPITRYNAAYQWFLRDANWSPDFPTAAEQALWFYEQERGPEKNIDGVIAITPTLIQSLLALTGEVNVGGLTFTTDNFVDLLQEQVDRGFLRQDIPLSERKEIIGVLSAEILDDLLSLPQHQWPDLWKIIQQNIDQKQIMVYVKDEGVQQLILKENWGGAIQNTDSDYLAVIDANLASLKSDPVVKRSLTYQIRRDQDWLVADVYITYTNEGTITWKTTRYRTYVRVYVPSGSQLITFDGAMIDCKIEDEGSIETTEELDKTAFATFVCTEPGESKTLHLKYTLPGRILDQVNAGQYQLLVQKQGGTAAHSLAFDLDFNVPIESVSGETADIRIDNSTAAFTGSLSQDQHYTVTFK